MIADAYLKGIRGFDAAAAFEAMKASASYGRYGGLADYMRLGYVPIDREPEAASKTLEYAYDDWTIARMAEALGRAEDHRQFARRARSFRSIFDPATGFMRAKKSDGSVPRAVRSRPRAVRQRLHRGQRLAVQLVRAPRRARPDRAAGRRASGSSQRLDQLFAFEVGPETFAQVEDITGLIGQYAHGNEPSQHIAYLYSYAGQPWRTQERVRQIMTRCSTPRRTGSAATRTAGRCRPGTCSAPSASTR